MYPKIVLLSCGGLKICKSSFFGVRNLPARILILEVTKLRSLCYLHLSGNEFISFFFFPSPNLFLRV